MPMSEARKVLRASLSDFSLKNVWAISGVHSRFSSSFQCCSKAAENSDFTSIAISEVPPGTRQSM